MAGFEIELGRPGRLTPIPACLQVLARCFAAYPGGLLDSPKRPTQLSKDKNLLLLFVAQDITHGGETSSPLVNVPASFYPSISSGLNGRFCLATNGRFWVATEA
jgi:hypothetical protein